MAAMLNSPVTVDGVTYRRVHFTCLAAGETLYRRQDGSTAFVRLGKIVEAPRDARGATRVTLDNGDRLTRRGWASRRLWRSV